MWRSLGARERVASRELGKGAAELPGGQRAVSHLEPVLGELGGKQELCGAAGLKGEPSAC